MSLQYYICEALHRHPINICLLEMTKEDNRCLAELLLTNPHDDKVRIERTKGGLFGDSFRWILENPEFQQWLCDEQSQLFWIKGDAGKGKTMLMIGIIDELSRRVARTAQPASAEVLSYFLCQGTDTCLNNATAILRGMIYVLIDQQPFLVSHLRKKYDHAGRKLFEEINAFYSLSEILRQMIQDPRLTTIYLVIDAVDECEVGLPELLGLITLTGSVQSSRVKWIVSSRKRDDIEQNLGCDDSHTRLSLELNGEHVSRAVDLYIDYKISKLVTLQHDKALQEQVRDRMRQKSNGTFLWVALVFEELRGALRKNLFQVLDKMPKGLTPLYNRMIAQVQQLKDDYPELCLPTLSTATLAYRPLHLLEMRILAGLQETLDLADMERIINMCGSFLTIRDNYVYFIHQSAKDYLHTSATVFPAGHAQIHYDIFSRSLSALSITLRRDIYNIQDPGPMTSVVRSEPDPLDSIRYSCVFWIDHFCDAGGQSSDHSGELSDNGAIFSFYQQHFLHWLESLSLIYRLSDGLLSTRKLLYRVQVCPIPPVITS
jgi:NACHT domain